VTAYGHDRFVELAARFGYSKEGESIETGPWEVGGHLRTYVTDIALAGGAAKPRLAQEQGVSGPSKQDARAAERVSTAAKAGVAKIKENNQLSAIEVCKVTPFIVNF
jgi:hypothetical protein